MRRLPYGRGLAGGALAATAAYRLADRLRRWGIRGDEADAVLPGEDLVPGPAVALTQAVTIAAPPVAVWPWIAQLGADKGGFYSYAWLENLGGAQVINTDRIVPAWQHPVPGEELRLHPRLALPIQRVEAGRLFVAGRPVTRGLGFQWIFVLRPEGPDRTRLLVRERYVVPAAPARAVARVATLGSAVMSQRMLRGIRDRAESSRLDTVCTRDRAFVPR